MRNALAIHTYTVNYYYLSIRHLRIILFLFVSCMKNGIFLYVKGFLALELPIVNTKLFLSKPVKITGL